MEENLLGQVKGDRDTLIYSLPIVFFPPPTCSLIGYWERAQTGSALGNVNVTFSVRFGLGC